MPYKVGITGGIGAGKSIICRVFNVLGVPVYDADTRAKWLMNNDAEIKKELILFVGEEVYFSSGLLNRQFLSQVAFINPELLNQVNAIVHPKVALDFQLWEASQSYPYVLKEAALLFESSSYKDLDSVITVTAPLELRIERVLQRDPQRNRAQILDIIDKQWPEYQKVALSNFVISNDEKELLIPTIIDLHQRFISEALKQ